jgi:predicted RNA-binding protein with PUA-like domain
MAKQKTNYWLFKSEPDVYSIDDLAAEKGKRTSWEGVRNYQVRNMLRDDIKVGDGVLFYHSRVNPMIIAGTAKVVKAGYADHFAFEPDHKYFDAKSDPENPRWFMVDVKFVQKFGTPVTRDDLRNDPATASMNVLAKGSRLSIQPVTEAEWKAVHRLAGAAVK